MSNYVRDITEDKRGFGIMYCNNCGKKVVEGSEFCPYCGSKINKANNETLGPINYKVYDIGQTKNKPKKKIGKGLIIVIICCIALIASAIYFTIIADNGSSKKSSSTNENIVQQEDFVTYELNEAGFYKNDNILEERFNQKGDLIYCKYKSSDEIYEENYSYIYDSQGRVTQITLNNSYETILNVDYIENDIIKITTNYEVAKYEYDFNYIEDQNVIEITEYSTANQTIGNIIKGQTKYEGKFIITTKNINGKQYSLITEINDNGQVERQTIYENNNMNSNSSLSMLNIIPLQYFDVINANKYTNVITEYLGLSCISLPIINGGNEIYSYLYSTGGNQSTTKNYYDVEGKILYSASDSLNYYYKYGNIEDNFYWVEVLMEADDNEREALGMEDNYYKQTMKFYANDNNEIYKYESYNEGTYLTNEEFATLKEEYMDYINNNKIDSDSIIAEFTEQSNNNNQTREQSGVDTTEIVDTEELGDIKLITTTNNSYKKNSLIEYLQDNEWVQDNLILKKNVFGEVIGSNEQQAVKYNVINDNMIITYTNYQGSGDGARCSILTYKDGKVNITRFEEGTTRYTYYTINKDNNILYSYHSFMGYTLYRIFKIKENGVEIIGSLEMDDYVDQESGNRILKYRFNKEEINKERYEELKSQYIVENDNNENKFETLFMGYNYREE